MPIDQATTLVAAERPTQTNTNPAVARRTRLLARISQQIEIVDAMLEGKPVQRDQRRLAKWWWKEGDRFFVAAYHARQPIELAKGKCAIQCSDFNAVGLALRKLAAMVEAGEFDAVVAQRATAVRARFGKAQIS